MVTWSIENHLKLNINNVKELVSDCNASKMDVAAKKL